MPTTSPSREDRDPAAILALLREEEVGRRARVATPFGPRLVHYADLTATGRFLGFVERWLGRVRPYYANTHTAVSTTGRILTTLREQARAVVHRSVGAGPDHEVLFCGAGATAAVNKLVGLLGLRIPEPLERRYDLSRHIPEAERPVVFVGPYEHHSNYLPWLESIAELVEVPADDAGNVCLATLEAELARHAHRPLRIGSFSAASNVTGVLTDVPAIARTLHAGGALAVFDYAAAGPYVPIDMSPADPAERIDALFLSPHKFLGGPGGSGVLVARRALFETRVPERPGGGTVDYVSAVDAHAVDYVRRLDEREEGGTPAILADLRAAAAFLVKEMTGVERILVHELDLARRATARLAAHPRIAVLGPTEPDRLAILSISIDGLHHDFASALLDHLFGIQNRAGCACAGPYGHRLLGIDAATSERFRRFVRRGVIGMKPGWVRLSLPYYASEEDIEFLLSAVELVAEHGHELLPLYRLDWSDGVWRHVENDVPDVLPFRLDLDSLRAVASGAVADDPEPPLSDDDLRAERARYFEEARALIEEQRRRNEASQPVWNAPTGDPEVDELAWFRYLHAGNMPA